MGGSLAPVVVLGAAAVVLLLLDLVWEGQELLLRGFALVMLGVAAGLAWRFAGQASSLSGMLPMDGLSLLVDMVALAGAAAAVLMRPPQGWGTRWSAYLALILWSAAGMALLGGAGNLIVLFLGVEVLSLGLYALAAFSGAEGASAPRRARSAEAGFKYFVLGGLGSGLLLYGAALRYAATGSLALTARPAGLLGGLGLVLLLAGLAFKLALAPFQLWTPDVYEGAPTPVTAFMAVGTKAAAFVALLRVVVAVLGPGSLWPGVVAVVGVGSMFVGYLLAMMQPGLKRLLACSGIANAGTVVLALLAPVAVRPVAMVYLAAYAAATLAAFAAVAALETAGAGDGLEALRGLASRAPWLTAVLVVALLSLASVPPTGGFLGKLLLLRALAAAGHPWVAVLVAVASLVALYPYLRLVLTALQPAPAGEAVTLRATPGWAAVAVAGAVAALVVGILPGPLLHG